MTEIAAYLASASYVTCLGGPPLANLKYGIIIVPAGEEKLLFGGRPKFEVTEEFIDAVQDANWDYGRALRMHDPDKDDEEFLRHRFRDDFESVSAEEFRNVAVRHGKENDGEEMQENGMEDEANPSMSSLVEVPPSQRPLRGSRSKKPPLTAPTTIAVSPKENNLVRRVGKSRNGKRCPRQTS